MMYGSQVIMLCPLNLYSAVCQLYQYNWKKKVYVQGIYCNVISNDEKAEIP